jgi:hypothetical protein
MPLYALLLIWHGHIETVIVGHDPSGLRLLGEQYVGDGRDFIHEGRTFDIRNAYPAPSTED